MQTHSADYWISALHLEPHPEGGWFREVWASGLELPAEGLPPDYQGGRKASSLIYYLLKEGELSAWHRVRSDELWLWHAGGTLLLSLGGSGTQPDEGNKKVLRLGDNAPDGFQGIVPRGVWQSAQVEGGARDCVGDYALVSCIVAPAFGWNDFSLA
jgi:predicted cupin superfamily sugar epimerase